MRYKNLHKVREPVIRVQCSSCNAQVRRTTTTQRVAVVNQNTPASAESWQVVGAAVGVMVVGDRVGVAVGVLVCTPVAQMTPHTEGVPTLRGHTVSSAQSCLVTSQYFKVTGDVKGEGRRGRTATVSIDL